MTVEEVLHWAPIVAIFTFSWTTYWRRQTRSSPSDVARAVFKFPLLSILYLIQYLTTVQPLEILGLYEIIEVITRIIVVVLETRKFKNHGIPQILRLYWMLSTLKYFKISWNQNFKTENALALVYAPLVLSILSVVFNFDRKESSFPPAMAPGNICPERTSSLLSKLCFLWVIDLKGWKETLTPTDLWDPYPENRSKQLSSDFWTLYQRSSAQSLSLFLIIFRLLSKPLFAIAVLQILEQLASFGSTQIFKMMLSPDGDSSSALTYLFLLLVVSTSKTVLGGHGSYQMGITTLRVRSYVTNSIYDKALRMTNYGKSESSLGEIVNMMTGDCGAIERFFCSLHLSWSIPLNILVSLYLQWQLLGPSVLAGLAINGIFMITNVVAGNQTVKLSQKEIKDRSQRITLMTEVLSAIQEIKLYTLEKIFTTRVELLRNQERKSIFNSALVNTTLNFFWSFALFLMSLGTFVIYVWIDPKNVLNSQKVFVYLALASSMSGTLKAFPAVVGTIIQVQISLKRIQTFLAAEEVQKVPTLKQNRESEDAVNIHDGFFKVGSFELRNINVKVRPGSLVVLIGKSGSGKSSLLSAMSQGQSVTRTAGKINLFGESCLLTQSPFILNDTIEVNILFGIPMQRARYERVVEACALLHDFDTLPNGDQTVAGNKGSNLSGGQRQRIALARVLYRKVDNYFLDSPLSAVDGIVGREIFNKALGKNGLLQNSTRVIVATSLRDLDDADRIYVIENGQIIKNGTLDEIKHWQHESGELVENPQSCEDQKVPSITKNAKESKEIINQIKWKESTGKVKAGNHLEEGNVIKLLDPKDKSILTSKWTFLPYYLSNCGWIFVFTTILMHFAQQGFGQAATLWLSKVTSTSDPSRQFHDHNKILSVYALLGTIQGFFHASASVLLTLGTLGAAKSFHKMMLRQSLGAKMTFYHKNHTTNILASFSRDIGDMDKLMGNRLLGWLTCAITVASTITVILFHRPQFLVMVIPLSLAYTFLLKYYRAKIMQLANLDVLTQAPIYAQFNESLLGMETIRALKAESSFTTKFHAIVDRNISCYFATLVSMRFHSICLDMLGNLFVFSTGLFVLYGNEDSSSGLLGVLLGYAFQVTGALNSLIIVTSTLENGMAVVQRIEEYNHIQQEEDATKPSYCSPNGIKGEITFNNFSTRYAEHLDLVLDGVTERIQPLEKIGVVGRTGSGKSSLMLSLVRILEAENGSIEIDGTNIAKMRIGELRKMITVVAQDPVLFSGTFRFNLDPFGERTTEDIWKTLEKVGLQSFIQKFPNGLNTTLTSNDPTFSFGQQQLLTLGRALLRNTPIIIFDEATSAMDESTQEVIGRLVATEFEQKTLLIIAHRLKTIMHSSRIMVIRDKTITECNTVESLLKNPMSAFYQMVRHDDNTSEQE